jgi:phage baseplate assembly protein W
MANDPIEAFLFPVAIDAGRGEIAKERDFPTYVDQLIRQVLLTSPGERVNLPTFGAGLGRMVFEPINDATATLAQTTVFQALNEWLGNIITVNNVKVQAQDSTLTVQIQYTLNSRGSQQILNLEVTP